MWPQRLSMTMFTNDVTPVVNLEKEALETFVVFLHSAIWLPQFSQNL